MASRFLWVSDSPTIITIKGHGLVDVWNNFQILKEFSKPYSLFGCFTSSHIFCFHCGVSNARLLNTSPHNSSTIKDEHRSRSGFPGILIRLKIGVGISRHSQVSTWVCKHQVPSSSKILKNMLNSNPVLGSRVGLETTNYANGETYIRSSAKHSIHEASYGRGVRNFPHVFNLLCSLGRLVLREWNSMPKGCLTPLAVLHREAIHHLINIRCLRERQGPVFPISKDLDPQNVRGFS